MDIGKLPVVSHVEPAVKPQLEKVATVVTDTRDTDSENSKGMECETKCYEVTIISVSSILVN